MDSRQRRARWRTGAAGKTGTGAPPPLTLGERKHPLSQDWARGLGGEGQTNHLQSAIALLALLGIGISGYLSYTHWTHSTVVCTGFHSCDYVQQSDYATLGGLPIAFLGLLLYAGILAGALVARGGTAPASLAGLAVFTLALAGALYSAYLTYVELFVLHAVCLWCVASALTVTAIFALAVMNEAMGSGSRNA